MKKLFIFISLFSVCLIQAQTVTGEPRKWHAVTIEFTDDATYTETGTPNPFMDRRLDVTFTGPSSQIYVVAGYFAADGDAAQTSATSGDKWHVKFSPDEIGNWTYTASFREGTDVAVTYPSAPTDGTAGFIDGQNGNFNIIANDKVAPDFRAKGRLVYDGTRYPKFSETNEYFIKAGPDSPEGLLGYEDFDDVYYYAAPNRIKDFTNHVADWQVGDPEWKTNQGRGVIGALNYISDIKGLNSISFLTMSKVRGDTKDVTMHVDDLTGIGQQAGGPIPDYTHYDVSRISQWDIVFSHAQSKGLFLHFKTQEQENADQLDENDPGKTPGEGGYFGRERKLYYREIIARFGHHLALNWNMGEENEGSAALGDIVTDAHRIQQLQYVADIDPYDHLRVVHSKGSTAEQDLMYNPLLGAASELTGVSLQSARASLNTRVRNWVDQSAANSKQWVVSSDETDSGAEDTQAFREQKLYGVYFAGGYGAEIYVSGQDLTLNDWRDGVLPNVWDYAKHALDFMNLIPFTTMSPDNNSLSGTNIGFSESEKYYAYYLDSGNDNPTLDIGNTGDPYTIKWFDPRNGGGLVDGTITSITSNGTAQNIGLPPSSTTSDWVVYATNDNAGNDPVTGVTVTPATATAQQGQTTQLTEDVAPPTAGNKLVTWSSDNTGVATVDNTGLVSHIGVGTANITVTTNEGGFTDVSAITTTAGDPIVPKAFYVGNNQINKVYMGDKVIYQRVVTFVPPQSEIVTSVNYPETGQYPPNDLQTWSVPRTKDLLWLDFISLDTEANFDFLRVYDGTDNTGTLLYTLSGTTMPEPVLTYISNVFFEFTSDGGTNGNGVEFSVTDADSDWICAREFEYPVGPGDYPSGDDYIIQFQPDQPGGNLEVSFSQFATEAGFDIMNIYEGTDATGTLLGTFSGTTLPSNVQTTSGGGLYIIFDADGGTNAAGFTFTINCI